MQGNGDVKLHGEDGQQIYYTKQADGSFRGAAGASAMGAHYNLNPERAVSRSAALDAGCDPVAH